MLPVQIEGCAPVLLRLPSLRLLALRAPPLLRPQTWCLLGEPAPPEVIGAAGRTTVPPDYEESASANDGLPGSISVRR